MGFIGKTVSGLFGGAPKAAAPIVYKAPDDVKIKSAAQIAAEDDAKKKAALIASNAGGATPAATVGGGNANVTQKILLGL